MDEPTPQSHKSQYNRRVRAEVMAFLTAYKTSHGCLVCDEARPACLVFHHKDPAKKVFEMAHCRDRGFKDILAEIEKCDVLCANCHLDLHSTLKVLGAKGMSPEEILEQEWLF